MTTPRSIEDRISSWIDAEGNVQLPDRILDAALLKTRETRQVGSSAWRFFTMFKPINVFITAGAAALVLAAALMVLRAAPAVPATSPGAPTPAPSIRVLTGLDQAFEVPAGSYLLGDPFTVPLTIATTDNWKLWSMLSDFAELGRERADNDTSYGKVSIMRPSVIYEHPCIEGGGPVTAGTTVDDVVAQLQTSDAFGASATSDTTIGGASGKTFTLDRLETLSASCLSNGQPLVGHDEFGTDSAVAPEQHSRVWVLDVAGQPLVILAAGYEGTTPVEQADAEQVVNSIVFE